MFMRLYCIRVSFNLVSGHDESIPVWFCLALAAPVLPAATGYYQHNLVADVAGVADFTDPNLVNAWGLATSATSPFWVCDAGTGLSTVYAASNTPGAALGTPNATLKPTIPGPGGNTLGVCTGIVANTATTSFNISNAANPTPRPSSFIFVTEGGALSAWANAVDPAKAVLVLDNSSSAVYKGLALVTTPTPQLYAANFRAGTIDVLTRVSSPSPWPPGPSLILPSRLALLRLMSGISAANSTSPMRSRTRTKNLMSPRQETAL